MIVLQAITKRLALQAIAVTQTPKNSQLFFRLMFYQGKSTSAQKCCFSVEPWVHTQCIQQTAKQLLYNSLPAD